MDQFSIEGFQEVICFVSHFDAWTELLVQQDEWVIEAKYELSQAQKKHWHLDTDCIANGMVIKHPGAHQGYLRLIELKGVEQEMIRSHSQSWDIGGIYDLDMRVKDVASFSKKMQRLGYFGFAPIKTYEFGKFYVSEILIKGPEESVLALIERHRPPLTDFPEFSGLSHAFNSSQIVRDIEAVKAFYMNILGFQVYMEYDLKGSDSGDNLFGVPGNIYKDLQRKICIVSPNGKSGGSIELVELVGLEGRDYSERAVPPNLGLMSLRFPVVGIDALRSHFKQNDVEEFDYSEIEMLPYANAKVLMVHAPNGVLLTFFEKQ